MADNAAACALLLQQAQLAEDRGLINVALRHLDRAKARAADPAQQSQIHGWQLRLKARVSHPA